MGQHTSLDDIYQADRAKWRDKYCSLHNDSLDKILPALEPRLIDVVRCLRQLVIEKQWDFWQKNYPLIFDLLVNITYLSSFQSIEETDRGAMFLTSCRRQMNIIGSSLSFAQSG